MSSITIRNLDPALKERLRVRAAEHGQSMGAEARRILHTALKRPPRPKAPNLYDRIRARLAPFGGADLDLPPRAPMANSSPLESVLAGPRRRST